MPKVFQSTTKLAPAKVQYRQGKLALRSSSLSLASQFALMAGAFLVVLGFATLGWLDFVYEGPSILVYGFPNLTSLIYNSMLFIGIGLVCGALIFTKFVLKESKPISENLQINLMFLVGSFLLLQSEALFGRFIDSQVQLDIIYFFMFMGYGLFSASLFLWNKERRIENRAGLRWEILIICSLSIIPIDFFVLNVAFYGIPTFPILPTPLLYLLGITLVCMVLGILRFRAARIKDSSNNVIKTVFIPSKKPIGRARISTAFVISIIALMGVLALPIFTYNGNCGYGLATVLSSFFTFGCF